MSIRCFFGQHDPGGLVARNGRIAVKCYRCDRISTGIAIDGPPPRVTQPKGPRTRLWWLRGVFETTKGA